MEIWIKVMERSWRPTGHHGDEPVHWSCGWTLFIGHVDEPVTNRTDSALLAWVYSAGYLWDKRVIRVGEGAGLISVAFLRGKIFSAIRHGIMNHFFYVLLLVEMPHVVTCSALVSGFITSPVGAHSSVNVSGPTWCVMSASEQVSRRGCGGGWGL